jgi:hypothetical protein
MKILTVALAATLLSLAACASHDVILTTGSQEYRQATDQEQRAADIYRVAGAPEAAAQAQKRADENRVKAEKKSDSFLDWLADLLFYSWLNTTVRDPSRPARLASSNAP